MSRRRKPPILNDEIRRLQQTMAVLIACQAAAAEGAEFDIADALMVVCGRVEASLRGLDQIEASMEVSDGRK